MQKGIIMEFKEYSLTNQRMKTMDLVYSIIATMFGASAIFGTITYIFNKGQAYIWFLWISSLALFIQGLWFTQSIYQTNAYTLPEAFGKVVHPSLRKASATLIAISWIGIIAAQLVAAGTLIQIFFPMLPYELSLILFTILIIVYTSIGGQKAVFITDKIQLLIMVISFVILTIILLKKEPFSNNLLNSQAIFGNTSLMVSWFISKGLSVLIGPDMYTRIRSAQNADIAKKASFIAGGIHTIISCIVLLLGVLLKEFAYPQETMFDVMTRIFSLPVLLLFGIGFFCAIASSCDTTLINAALIIENDLIQQQNIQRTSLFIWIIGLLSLCLALFSQDILNLIMMAYSLYAPVSVPLFITGLLVYRYKKLNSYIILSYFIIGIILSLYGIINNASFISIYVTILGIFVGISAIILGEKID